MEPSSAVCLDKIFSSPPQRRQGKAISKLSGAETSFEKSPIKKKKKEKKLKYGSKAFEHRAQINSNVSVKKLDTKLCAT